MALQIRAAVAADSTQLRQLRAASIRHLAASHYSPAQLEAWITSVAPDFPDVGSGGGAALVAMAGGRLLGFAAVRFGERPHLWALYVEPASASRGLGSRLLLQVERLVHAAAHSRLWVAASCNAVRFYQRRGYGNECSFEHRFRDGHDGWIELPVVSLEKTLSTIE